MKISAVKSFTNFAAGSLKEGKAVSSSKEGSKEADNEKAQKKDTFYSAVSRSYLNGAVKQAVFDSKDREAKNGKYIMAQAGTLALGAGMTFVSLIRGVSKNGGFKSNILEGLKPSNLKNGLGAKLGLVLLIGSMVIGVANRLDAKKTAKERGVDKINGVVTSERLEALQKEAKVINEKIANESDRLLTMEYKDNLAVFQKVAGGK